MPQHTGRCYITVHQISLRGNALIMRKQIQFNINNYSEYQFQQGKLQISAKANLHQKNNNIPTY